MLLVCGEGNVPIQNDLGLLNFWAFIIPQNIIPRSKKKKTPDFL